MIIYLDDTKCKDYLLPFAATRHVGDIRIGILSIKEKWQKITGAEVLFAHNQLPADAIVINANILPTIKNSKTIIRAAIEKVALLENDEIHFIHHPWQIFQLNEICLKNDFELLTSGRDSAKLSETNKLIGSKKELFIEEGAVAEHCIFNTTQGPIYLGKDTLIMEGSMIRGPFAACDGAVVKMGAKIYGATTLGPGTVAGGEIKNVVFFGNSNKAHDGYLGDSVIGEWCNLGAGTSNSNIKNTAGPVKYFINDTTDFAVAGNKGGVLMGDYTRCAINTSFNTGTVAGVCCNIFTPVMHMKHIADFTWGNDRYIFEKAISDIDNWKKLKGKSISEQEVEMLSTLYNKKD